MTAALTDVMRGNAAARRSKHIVFRALDCADEGVVMRVGQVVGTAGVLVVLTHFHRRDRSHHRPQFLQRSRRRMMFTAVLKTTFGKVALAVVAEALRPWGLPSLLERLRRVTRTVR